MHVSNNKFSAHTAPITGLAWGMHRQFRDYIQRMSDGRMLAADGAELLETGETWFPLDHTSTTDTELRFTGSLQFVGHHGMLAVNIQQPWLQHSADTTSLTIIDPFDPTSRMALVTVELDADGTGTTRLTEAGTDLFMGNYRDDTVFDPVRIVWAGKD